MNKDSCNHHADKGSCVGLISSALPEAKNKIFAASSDTGVSTHCIHAEVKNPKEQQNWYALRTTYGREKKAYDYLVAKHMHEGARITKSPLIVPQNQIEGLKIICESEADDILYVPEEVQKFKEGQMVRVIDGKFKGVTGRVARYQGQQRVAIIIDGGFTMATAYLPTAFLEYIIE